MSKSKLRIFTNGHEVDSAYQSLILSGILGITVMFGRLRRIVVAVYLLALIPIISDVSYMSIDLFRALLIILIVFQLWMDRWERVRPEQYQTQRFRIIRFHYYLLIAAALLFFSQGVDYVLLLFIPYILFATIYVGPLWDVWGVFEAAFLVFAVLFVLSATGNSNFTASQIVVRVIGIVTAGGLAVIHWRSVVHKVEKEALALYVAQKLTTINPTKPINDVLASVFDFLNQLLNYDQVLVIANTLHPDIFDVIDSRGLSSDPTLHFKIPVNPGEEGFTGEVLRTREPLLIPDSRAFIAEHGIKPKFPLRYTNKAIDSYLGIPLIVDQVLIGALAVGSHKTRHFRDGDCEVLEEISPWIATIIHSAISYRRISEVQRYLQELIDLTNHGVIVSDESYNIVMSNSYAQEALRYVKSELSEKKVTDLLPAGQAAVDLIKNVLDETELGTSVAIERMKTADDETIEVSLKWSTVHSPVGERFIAGFFRERGDVPLEEVKLTTLLSISELAITWPMASTEDQAKRIIDILQVALGQDIVIIIRVKNRDNHLVPVAVSDTIDISLVRGLTLDRGGGISGQVVYSREGIGVEDVQKDIRFQYPQFAASYNLHAGFFLPLQLRNEPNLPILGTLAAYHHGTRTFSNIEKDLLKRAAGQIAMVFAVSEIAVDSFKRRTLEYFGEIATDVARDMRNPIHSIRGWKQLLSNELGSEKSTGVMEALSQIDIGIGKLEALSNVIAKSTREIVPSLQQVPLDRIIKDAIKEVLQSPEIVDKQDMYNINVDVAPIDVQADPVLIKQAFVNIVHNALDAQPTGGEVWIRSDRIEGQKDTVRLVVDDSGTGISTKDFDTPDQVFRPFSSSKLSPTRQTFGLGLAFTHNVFTAHNWDISVRNKLGGGAEFTIKINLPQTGEVSRGV